MSDCMRSQDPQDRPSGERDGLDAPATAALAPCPARERYARIIDPGAFEDDVALQLRRGGEMVYDELVAATKAWNRGTAYARADAILADQAELIAQRAALVDLVVGLLRLECPIVAEPFEPEAKQYWIDRQAEGDEAATLCLTARALLAAIQAGGAS